MHPQQRSAFVSLDALIQRAVAALQTRPFDRVMTFAGQRTMLPEQVEQEIDALQDKGLVTDAQG